MTDDFSKIDRLVSDFEAGLPVDLLLAEINADESLMFNWGHDHFDDFDYSELVHETSIFVPDDSLEEYCDLEELRNLKDEKVAQYIFDRVEDCFDSVGPVIHFVDLSHSVISALGDVRGQGGYWFIDLDISKTRESRYQKLLEAGYLFLPNDYFVIPSDFLIRKYQKFIRDRLSAEK